MLNLYLYFNTNRSIFQYRFDLQFEKVSLLIGNYSYILDNERKIEDIRNGLKIWDKYIQGLKTELMILVPAASEKSEARTKLENKR